MPDQYKLKQLDSIGPFSIWSVDGHVIRKSVEPDFTNYAQHYQFPDLIPENEFWIDKDDLDELPFYVIHMLHEFHLMRDGMDFEGAVEKAGEIEHREREKSTKYQQNVKDVDVVKVKLENLGVSNGVTVWLVDGELVRDFYDEGFTEGGHDLAYLWIPNKEVWIDDDVGDDEIEMVLLHELFERSKMADEGISYEQAHLAALGVEHQYRWGDHD